MAMTKQDFEAIAAAVADEVKSLEREGAPDFYDNGQAFECVERIALRIATHAGRTNRNFNRRRFLDACGLTKTT